MYSLYRLDVPISPSFQILKDQTGQDVANLIRELAGIPSSATHWGAPVIGADVTLVFDVEELDNVTAAIGNLEEEILVRVKKARLEDIAGVRREYELKGPMGLVLDDKTVARLTAAATWLMLDPEQASVKWELSRGNFAEIPRAQVLALAVGAGRQVQACFDKVSDLTDVVSSALTPQDVLAVDITSDWPTP